MNLTLWDTIIYRFATVQCIREGQIVINFTLIYSLLDWECLGCAQAPLTRTSHRNARGTQACCSLDKVMHQLGVLSLLLQFDKYNFKRSSQTASAGRLHNEHNNSPPPGSSSLVHLPSASAAMSVRAHVSLFHSEPLRLPTSCSAQSGCMEEPFGPHF